MNKKSFISLLIVLFSVSMMLAACGESKQPAPASAGENKPVEKKQEPKQNDAPKSAAKTVDSLKLTLAGGSAGGFWSLIGEGAGNILRQAIPNSQFSYETGNGVKNTIDVAAGKIPMGIAHNFEVKAGLNGEPPYKEKVSKVVAIATMYNNAPFQIIISKEFADKYGIKSIEDIAKKKPPMRAAVNQRGNLTEKANRLSLEAYGITYDDIKKWGGEVYYEPYKTGLDMMKDGKVDWVGVNAFVPDGKVLEVATSKKLMLLSLNEKAQTLMKEQMGKSSGVIAANSYEWQTENINTSNAGAIIMVKPDMSDAEAYTITKSLIENIEKIQALHKDLKALTPQIMADVSPAKLHPGAEKYYKEKGIIK